MLLFNALQQLASQPAHIARRAQGPMLMVNDRMKVLTFRTGKEYRWVPKFRDLIADDWDVISLDKLIEETRLMQEQAQLAQSEEADING